MGRIKIGFGQRTAFPPECLDPWFRRSAVSLLRSAAHVFRSAEEFANALGGKGSRRSYDSSHEEALCLIASVSRGSIYVAAEQLATDPELAEVDQLYREVGLRRTRHIWLAYREYKDEPIGAVIAYRGPLGLNFSYIENRCDLLLHPTLPEADVEDVVAHSSGHLLLLTRILSSIRFR